MIQIIYMHLKINNMFAVSATTVAVFVKDSGKKLITSVFNFPLFCFSPQWIREVFILSHNTRGTLNT